MSRAKATDVSSPISLFPFIGVLLCTMGALLVVLIAVSPSAREVALRQVAARQRPNEANDDPESQRALAEIQSKVAKLNALQVEAKEKLRRGQARLSHLESHMRDLQNQLQSVQLAAAELDALEKEHYDDRRQAEDELKRRKQLIAEMHDVIDTARNEAGARKRSYALVPYDGPNGTLRRPIYVECRQNELILQPEGIRISDEDLRPPYGPGNPLASVLRAARAYLVSMHPGEGQHRDVEPYALLILRPSGVSMFAPAQKALQSSDFDFGYELVEEDWNLKYPAPDPQLAIVEQQGLDQARIRQEALAAAAPRAYRHPALAQAGRFEFDDAAEGRARQTTGGWPRANGIGSEGNTGTFGAEQNDAGLAHSTAGGGSPAAAGARESPSTSATAASGEGGQSAAGPAPQGATNASATGGVAAGDPTLMSGATRPTTLQSPSSDGSVQIGSSGGTGLPALSGNAYTEYEPELAKARGAGWALPRKNARAVSIQRTIQVVVSQDQLTIVAERTPHRQRMSVLKSIPLSGDTVESIDAFVQAVHDQIDYWGMAGEGMTWRPVLSLHVNPGAERRADDLTRLLKDSGLEITPAATATLNPAGDTRATPR